MKKIIVIMILLFSTGCWNYQELSSYAIVTGMAIDYIDGEYEISILISNGNNKDETNVTTVVSGKGDSIYKAYQQIGLISPKELYVSHMSVVIISENYARHGISNLLDFLMRDSNFHQSFFITIAKESKAKDVLSTLSPLANYASQNITEKIKSAEKLQGEIITASFIDFIKKYLEPGIHPIANSIIIKSNSDDEIISEKQEFAETSLDSIGIFKKDKLIGWASLEESIGISYITNNITYAYVQTKCEDNYIINTIDSYEVKYNVKKDKIIVNVKAGGTITEINCKIDITDSKIIKQLEKDVSKEIKRLMYQALSMSQNLKTDIFGFGMMIHKKYPDYFDKIDDWDDEFTKLKVEFNVEFKYHSEGSIEQNLEEFKL